MREEKSKKDSPRRHGGTEKKAESGLYDEAADAVFQNDCVKVQYKADRVAAKAEIGQELRVVQRAKVLHRFDLENQGLLDNNVHLVSAVQADALVDQR